MNNKLTKLNENLAIVSDEVGTMRAIEVDNDKELENILVRENILENANFRLEKTNKELENYKEGKTTVLESIITFIGILIFLEIVAGPPFKLEISIFNDYCLFFRISIANYLYKIRKYFYLKKKN